jgi:hypothetical protein
VAHFSRSLREVGDFADILPTLNQRLSNFLSHPGPPVLVTIERLGDRFCGMLADAGRSTGLHLFA